jgi:hypothetical protein
LIFIFFLAKDIEQFFMYLLTTMLLLLKTLSSSFAHY